MNNINNDEIIIIIIIIIIECIYKYKYKSNTNTIKMFLEVLITFCKILGDLEFSSYFRHSCHYGYLQF